METLVQISVYSTLVLVGIAAAAGLFVFTAHALAAEAVEEDPHAH